MTTTATEVPRHDSAAGGDRIPFADIAAQNRELRRELDDAVSRVFDSARFIGGPEVERFEQEWAAYCGTSHAIGVANGTDALHLALRAAGVGPGDEVVVPANTFVATVEAVVLAGATPRFADVAPETLLLTAETLAAAVTPRTRAVIVVHLYGQMADMDAIGRAAERSGLLVFEDAAQAHGATWRGGRAGSFGVAGCFSFYPGKNLGALGDAGAVVTDDPDLAHRLRSMRDHGRAEGSHHEHPLVGTNSRMDAVQAALLSVKLRRLDEWTAARRTWAELYRRQLEGSPARLVGSPPQAEHVYHLLVARVPDRERLRRRLDRAGIDTGLHYPAPCHVMAPYRRYADGSLPVVERSATSILSLPLSPHMTADQVTRVTSQLQDAISRGGEQ